MKKSILIFSVFLALWLYADAPNRYYKGAEKLKGKELKALLHRIIKDHTEFEYSDAWKFLSTLDQDSKNSKNVILFYSGRSISKRNQARGWREKENDSYWNREHVWAKSFGVFNTERPAGTDLHHLRASDRSVNKMRGRKFFDNGGKNYKDPDGGISSKTDFDSWEPRDAIKGDVARMLFYMAVRYEGGEGTGGPDLELVNRVVTRGYKPIHGKLSTLIAWHKQDPVDNSEKNRNDQVFSIQKNRNPFIDHPEFVAQIWDNHGILDPKKDKKQSKALTISKALSAKYKSTIVVVGFIREGLNKQYGIKLAESMNPNSQFLAIKLPTDKIEIFSPYLTKSVKGKKVVITGVKEKYLGKYGIKTVTSIFFAKD